MKIYTNFVDGCVRFFVYKSYKKLLLSAKDVNSLPTC